MERDWQRITCLRLAQHSRPNTDIVSWNFAHCLVGSQWRWLAVYL